MRRAGKDVEGWEVRYHIADYAKKNKNGRWVNME
jgi:hypothetical protein